MTQPRKWSDPPPPPDPGNPDPGTIRKWHIANPYTDHRCYVCSGALAKGELIDILYETGLQHARHEDEAVNGAPVTAKDPAPGSAGSSSG